MAMCLFQVLAAQAAEHPEEDLANLVRQADFIALVQMPDLSPDSLPYVIDDLGTGLFTIHFEVLTLYKKTFPQDVNAYLFEHSDMQPIGSNVFIRGKKCYLFLSNNEPITIGDARDLRQLKNLSGLPSLLLGGLIQEDKLKERELKRLCKPHPFVKAALDGDFRKMKRMIKSHLEFLNQFELTSSNMRFFSFPSWLSRMQGMDGVILDSCAVHISIWPGWSDYFFWINTPTGRIEYQFVIQHGKTKRFPLNYLRRGYNEEWVLKTIVRTSNMRESLIERCKQDALNRKRDAYNYIVRLFLDEGRLNWSVVNAPAHLDSEGDIFRVKLSLYNAIDSAMYLRWPGNQNSGRKLFQFVLKEKKSFKVYRELSNQVNLNCDSAIGPNNQLVIAQDTISAWHSINDPFLEQTDVSAAHRFEKLPPGEYQLWVVYDPYPEAVSDTLCWLPYCDSLTYHAGYSFWIQEDTLSRNMHLQVEVLKGPESFVNNYGQRGVTSGLVKVISNDRLNGPAEGSILAWKQLEDPYQTNGSSISLQSDSVMQALKPGDIIELDLINSNAGGTITTESGVFRLYGTSPGCCRFK
jgi:hypothetical protein